MADPWKLGKYLGELEVQRHRLWKLTDPEERNITERKSAVSSERMVAANFVKVDRTQRATRSVCAGTFAKIFLVVMSR